jgi:hypothetical protein
VLENKGLSILAFGFTGPWVNIRRENENAKTNPFEAARDLPKKNQTKPNHP